MSCTLRCLYRALFIIFISIALTACGGGGGGGSGSGGSSGGGGGSGSYTVSVVTSGLTGSGLTVGMSSDAGQDTMTITSNGTREFNLKLPAGSLYTVGIGTQPSGQSCSSGGQFFGTSISSDVTVTVTCVSTQSVGGTVSGLSGTLVLRLNGGNSISLTSNGSFTFNNELASGTSYAVTVGTQPAGQICLVSNSYGQIGTTAVTDIAVNCSAESGPGYKVGGNVSGFSGVVVLNLNGLEQLPQTYNGSFTFSTSLATGTAYSVTVDDVTPGYECLVVNGTGIIGDSDYPFVDVNCQTSSTQISPKVDPDGANLGMGESMTVTLNGSEDLVLDDWDWNPVAFNTVLSPDEAYEVTVKTQPPGQVCALYNSAGVIEAGDIPLITMNCVSDTASQYTIGGSISNLSGTGLVLSLDGRESLSIAAGETSYVFPNPQLGGMFHYISVKEHPVGQICSVTNSSSWLSGDVTNVNVICSDGSYSIGGYIAGLTNTGLTLQLNGIEALLVAANSGSFTFSTQFASGMSYEVGILEQPVDQTCTLSNASGYNITASVNDVIVDCRPRDYAVAVNVTGYSGSTPMLLQLNDDEILEISANTAYSATLNAPEPFTARLRNGEAYSVTIAAQPEGRLCSLANAAGIIDHADVTNIGVVCAVDGAGTGSYTVGVTTTGLAGSGLTLQLNGGNDLAISSNGYTLFAASLADSANYTVTVQSPPTMPIQLCEVVNGTGTIASANVTNISVQCGNAIQSRYPLNGGQWLYYVKNDGANEITASDTACDPATDTGGYGACLNGGEFMTVALPHYTSCTGVTASDNLNAFDWACDDSDGIRVVSTGLKVGVSLTDLVDFDEGAFKPNFVTVSDGSMTDETQPAVWWTNPVLVNNTGETRYYKGEIHLVTGTMPSSYTMYESTALLVKSGYAIAGNVSAGSRNYLWFEGAIDGSDSSGLSWSGTEFSVVNNVQAQSNASDGISISGNNLKLRDLIANGNMGIGVYLYGRYLDVQNLTANDNLGYQGVSITGGNITLVNIVANDNVNGSGIKLSTWGDITLTGATTNGNGVASASAYDGHSGVELIGNFSELYPNHVFTNLTASGNLLNGVFIDGISASSFSNVNVHDNGQRGFQMDTAETTQLSNINATGNGEDGIRLYRWSSSKGDSFIAANNGGHGVHIYQSSAIFSASDVTSSNNAGSGYVIESSSRVISANVTAVNNVGSGVAFLGSSTSNYQNVLIGATSANNGSHGVEMTRMQNVQLSSILSANNGGDGFYTYTFIDNVSLVNLLSANNTGYGFHIGSDYDYFGGLLHMGNNGAGDCLMDYTFAVQPGLIQGGSGNNLNNDCVLNGYSDGTIVIGVDASSSLVGKIMSDDAANPDDTLGAAQYDSISSWLQFDNAYRAWGVDGALAFADDGNQGACNSPGASCRIWDWSASLGDTGNSGSPAVYDVVAMPTITDILSLDWTTSSATDQAYCDTNFPGSTWDGAGGCTSTYLRAAWELSGDAVGNDNYLCEAGESCLYLPNIGSYQGHGATVSAGSVGTMTLFKYESLAR